METRILLNDFKAQWRMIGPAVLQAVERVGQSGWLILGDETAAFEQALANFCGLKHAVGCASGLDGLEIALRVASLQIDDEVITTPLSAFATTLAILRAGGRPHFVDVDQSGLLDLAKVESRLKQQSQPAFLLPVHLYGHSVDLEWLSELKLQYDLRIIEDCAQSLGATSGARAVGSVGQISATSFYPTKNLGCMGDGGAVLTDSDEYAAVAKRLRNYGQEKRYLHTMIGINSRLDELQAAIMRHALLPRLAESTERRRNIATAYLNSIDNAFITIPPAPSHSNSVYHLFPILVDGDRELLRRHLLDNGIESGVHYPTLIPHQPAMKNQPFSTSDELATAAHFADHEVSLPMHAYLSDEEIKRVVESCNSWKPR
jgi:dTDP-3-amino-3,4,6-trideoxy-alpha-D-glucose transaminase